MGKARLLSGLSTAFFYDDSMLAAFKRIKRSVRRNAEIPTWDDLCTDSHLAEEARADLEDYTHTKPLKNDRHISRCYDSLNEYRKARTLFFESEAAIKALSQPDIDIDEIIESMADKLVSAQTSGLEEHKVLTTGGENSNSRGLLEKLLSNDRGEVIPTGFAAFDHRNGGFTPSSLVVIAATTGGGKSAMANQLAINMSLAGKSIVNVPLEMSERECMARTVSNVAQINTKKYLYTELTKREVKASRKAWYKFEADVTEAGGVHRIFEPQDDLTIEELLTLLRPYNDDVIIIDYVGLLKGVDGDDSWLQLGKAARYAKVWAKNNNKLVILLAQLSDEGAIRYARSIKEHANNLWSWVYTDENRETGIIDIIPQKSRNQEMFDFQLAVDFSTMRIYDVTEQEQEHLDRVKQESRRSETGRKKHRKLKEAGDDIDKYLDDKSG